VLIDRGGHRHDEDAAALQVREVRAEGEARGGLELRPRDFQRAVAAADQLRDAMRLDVESQSIEMLAELDRERQAHITQTDHADAALAQMKHDPPQAR